MSDVTGGAGALSKSAAKRLPLSILDSPNWCCAGVCQFSRGVVFALLFLAFSFAFVLSPYWHNTNKFALSVAFSGIGWKLRSFAAALA